MVNYKEKYLKYKLKYLNIKNKHIHKSNIKGGVDQDNIPELELGPPAEGNMNNNHVLEQPEEQNNDREINMRRLPMVIARRIFDVFRLNNQRAREDNEEVYDLERGVVFRDDDIDDRDIKVGADEEEAGQQANDEDEEEAGQQANDEDEQVKDEG